MKGSFIKIKDTDFFILVTLLIAVGCSGGIIGIYTSQNNPKGVILGLGLSILVFLIFWVLIGVIFSYQDKVD